MDDFKQNPKLKRLLKSFGTVQTRHRIDDVRIHHVIEHVLYLGETSFRGRHRGITMATGKFYRAALAEFDRRQLIYRVEARIYLPVYTRPEHFKIARAQGGTPIWLPSLTLETAGDAIWKSLAPHWTNGEIVW